MTFPEPAPALNPVLIEHRLTLVEQATLSLQENQGNLTKLIDKVNSRVNQQQESLAAEGELRRQELAALQDGLDLIADGIKARTSMEEAHRAGYAEGQKSITVKLPWRQVAAVTGVMTAIVGAVEAGVRIFV